MSCSNRWGRRALLLSTLAICAAACDASQQGEAPPAADAGAPDLTAAAPDAAPAAAAQPVRLTTFQQLTEALTAGYAVRGVVHYKVCDLLPGKLPFDVDVTGAMAVRQFDLVPRQTGKPKAYVEFSDSSLVWLYSGGKWRYVQDNVRFRVYDDLQVLVHANYYDPSSYSVRMDEQLACKVDPGRADGAKYGVSLFRLPGAPRQLGSYKALMAALRGGQRVHAQVHLDKCKDASGAAGPSLTTSVGVEVFEQFERNVYGNALAYVSASSNSLEDDGTTVKRRYIKLRLREDGSVQVVFKRLDPVKFTDSSDETYSCAMGSSVTIWSR